MSALVTIVMYHYVRDLRRSRFPDIKGLSSEEFEEQVRYIKSHYNVISGYDLMDAVSDGSPLPPKPLMLTFDDGYIDHFTEVFPVLEREKLSGCVFPPAKCILEHRVLDVNKIHFILAAVADKNLLVSKIFERIRESESDLGLRSCEEYWEALGKPNRWDPPEVAFCKRILQRELPVELRQAIVDELFGLYVTGDEANFARELYMTPDQIAFLQQRGMCIGSHGYDHCWLNRLTERQQEDEIDKSLSFLSALGVDITRWIMCYPYGAYNDSLLSILRSRNCVAGLTTEVGLADLKRHDPLTLPRINTNDLPKSANGALSEWTAKVGG